jgi:hypothetical protein
MPGYLSEIERGGMIMTDKYEGLVNIGNMEKSEFAHMLNYLRDDNIGITVCGRRYISKSKLQRHGYPINLLKRLHVLDGTAIGHKINGSKTTFYSINNSAINSIMKKTAIWLGSESYTHLIEDIDKFRERFLVCR